MDSKSEFITIIHLIIIYTIFFVFAFIISNILNLTSGALDKEKYRKRNVFIILLEILIEIIIVGISAFYCNIFISKLVMPFDISLSRASRIDANGAIIISFMMMFFQTNLKMKLKFLYEKVFQRQHISIL
jgi:hypothetical protein